MGFFSRIGNKLSHLYDGASRLGNKVLGTASRIGHKVSDVGHSVVNAVKTSPLMGIPMIAGATSIADRVLAGVDKGTALADKAIGIKSEIDKAVSKGRSALEKKPTAPVDAGIQKHSTGPAGPSLRETPKQKVVAPINPGRRG